MGITVQKFGGTSVSDSGKRKHVLRHVARERSAGRSLVVVVSAMGRRGEPYATDTLLDLVRSGKGGGIALPKREKDLLLACGEIISAAVLAAALADEGIPCVTLTGAQAGIVTNDDYGNARIAEVQPERILAQLQAGNVVIVAGFQGVTASGDITTLGRGGSDTTAAALGAALGADTVDIFTDVDGVLTADPRMVKDARPLAVVSYEEASNMAHNGAKVIHPRAVEIAMRAGVPLRVRSTFSESEGTLVTSAQTVRSRPDWADRAVTGLAYFSSITQISVEPVDGAWDAQLHVFREMAMNGISVDLINVMPSGVHYTVKDEDATAAQQLLRGLGYEPRVRPNCTKLSVIGGGMNDEPGVMARIVEALTTRQITILQSADSNTTIWILVTGDAAAEALEALHAAFGLHLATHL